MLTIETTSDPKVVEGARARLDDLSQRLRFAGHRLRFESYGASAGEGACLEEPPWQELHLRRLAVVGELNKLGALETALLLARSGIKTFPACLEDGNKKSYLKEEFCGPGEKWGMSNDPEKIQNRFNRRAWRNKVGVGVPTGAGNGIFVIEGDTKKGHGVDGLANLKALQAKHGEFTDTLMARSPTGSIHRYYKHPGGRIKSGALAGYEGIDIKGDGGMVIAPTSMRPGVGRYEWLNDLPIADAPAWLLELVRDDDAPKENSGNVPDDPYDFNKPSLEEVEAAMRAIPNDDKVDRKQWVDIGHALKSAYPGDDGLKVFKKWSTRWTGGEYNEKHTVTAWKGFEPNRTGVNKLFKLADEADPSWRDRAHEAKAAKTEVEKNPDGENSLLGYSWRLRWHGEVEIADSRPYLIQNVLPEVGTGKLSGQWGTHKTFLGLDITGAVMSGKSFILDEFAVRRKGGVLFVACEGENELAIRLTAVVQEKYPEIGDKVPFAWVNDCPRLLDRNASKILTAMVKDAGEKMMQKFGLPVVMVIFDTAGKAAGFTKTGEENDAATDTIIVRALEEIAKACGVFVLGIDHFGKDASVGTRGTSGKEGNTDVILAMLGEKDIEGRVTNTRLCLRKRKGGPNGEEFPYKTRVVDMGFDQYGSAMDTLVLEWLAEDEAAKRAPRDAWGKAASLRLLRTCLLNLSAEASIPGTSGNGSEKLKMGIDVEAVRKDFYACHLAEGTPEQKTEARRKAFRRVVTEAQKLKLIELREQKNGVTLLRMLEL
jgi:Bifunctional DNA primase/polymerase, N-terminal/AAA domain/Primase C terminal 2 (PriCT-2)